MMGSIVCFKLCFLSLKTLVQIFISYWYGSVSCIIRDDKKSRMPDEQEKITETQMTTE